MKLTPKGQFQWGATGVGGGSVTRKPENVIKEGTNQRESPGSKISAGSFYPLNHFAWAAEYAIRGWIQTSSSIKGCTTVILVSGLVEFLQPLKPCWLVCLLNQIENLKWWHWLKGRICDDTQTKTGLHACLLRFKRSKRWLAFLTSFSKG